MTIDRNAIDDMTRLMSILNEKSNLDDAPLTEEVIAEGIEVVVAPASHVDPNVDAMKAILERFQSTASSIFESEDPDVREALQTEQTATGARIGSWEIVVHDGDDHRQYDVVHSATREPIAKNLYVYEAAYGLAKRLNEGVTINDKRVRALLRLEEDFAKHRDDAAHFRKRTKSLREKGEDVRAAISEDRYDDAQRRAIDAHERILRLAGLR